MQRHPRAAFEVRSSGTLAAGTTVRPSAATQNGANATRPLARGTKCWSGTDSRIEVVVRNPHGMHIRPGRCRGDRRQPRSVYVHAAGMPYWNFLLEGRRSRTSNRSSACFRWVSPRYAGIYRHRRAGGRHSQNCAEWWGTAVKPGWANKRGRWMKSADQKQGDSLPDLCQAPAKRFDWVGREGILFICLSCGERAVLSDGRNVVRLYREGLIPEGSDGDRRPGFASHKAGRPIVRGVPPLELTMATGPGTGMSGVWSEQRHRGVEVKPEGSTDGDHPRGR